MSKAKLLVVEDDPNLGDILQEYLQMKGYDTTLCRDGVEGWNKFKKDKFDLCLLDVMMPRHNGFDILQDLKPEPLLKKTAFVMLTSLAQESDIVKGFHLGADEYIVKPFSIAELEARLLRLAKSRKT